MPTRKGRSNKYKGLYSLHDIYAAYKQKTVPYSKLDIDYATYKRISHSLLGYAMDAIIEDADEVYLGTKVCSLRIKKIKTNPELLKVDWSKTKPGEPFKYHLNLATKGYHVRFFWSRKRARVPHKTIYAFMPTKARKVQLSKAFLSGKDYFQ